MSVYALALEAAATTVLTEWLRAQWRATTTISVLLCTVY